MKKLTDSGVAEIHDFSKQAGFEGRYIGPTADGKYFEFTDIEGLTKLIPVNAHTKAGVSQIKTGNVCVITKMPKGFDVDLLGVDKDGNPMPDELKLWSGN